MNFHDQLIITLIDKLAIGLFLLLGGFFLSRQIEGYKGQKTIESQMSKVRDEKRLEFLERQLSEFYWPLYIRLEKDRSIWRWILGVNKKKGSLDQRMAVEIEKEVILPNHKAMIQLIETRIHLAQPESRLMAELMQYVERATEYQALRDAGDTKRFAVEEIGAEWLHQSLFEEIKRITELLQSQYNSLVKDSRHASH